MVNISTETYFFTAGRRPKIFRIHVSWPNSNDVTDGGSGAEPPRKKLDFEHQIVSFCLRNRYFTNTFRAFRIKAGPRFPGNYPTIDDEYFFFSLSETFFFTEKKSPLVKKKYPYVDHWLKYPCAYKHEITFMLIMIIMWILCD